MITLSATGFLSAASAQTYAVTPHSARYTLSLLETRMGEISMLDGVLTFDIVKSCEEWTVQSSLDLISGNPEGGVFKLVLDHQATESLDGTRLAFETRTEVNDQVLDVYQGRAEVDMEGRGEAQFVLPKEATVPLPKGTTFPMMAMARNLQAIWGEGQRHVTYIYFDGSELSAWRGSDLVAGKPDPIDDTAQDPDGMAQTEDARRIVTTLFDLSQTDSEPQTTIITDTLPNGVITRLTIDVGFMVAEARLSEILEVSAPVCPGKE